VIGWLLLLDRPAKPLKVWSGFALVLLWYAGQAIVLLSAS
jgi:hypothetical protein